jgi:3-oxoacyl-[acyl-carrier-protein] synthase II
MSNDAIVALAVNDWVMLRMPGAFEQGGTELHHGLAPRWDLTAGELVPSRELKNFDRQSLLLLAAMSLIEDANQGESLARAAVIGGTSNGSIDTVIQLIKESNESRFAFQVNPAQIPNTVINSSVGQLAIKYGIKGANVSLCAKELSFYSAMVQGLRFARRGDCERIYATAMETFSGEFGTLYADSHGLDAAERIDTAAIFSFRTCSDPQTPGPVVRSCVTGRLFPTSGASLGDLILTFVAGNGVALDRLGQVSVSVAESWRAALDDLGQAFGEKLAVLQRTKALSLSLVGAYQLADLAQSVKPGDVGVMACVDEEGFYGIALVGCSEAQAGAAKGSRDSSKVGDV